MHIHALTLMILQLNKLVDSGKYSDISISDVHRAIDEERIIEMLQERAGEDFDVSLINIYEGAREEYETRLNQIYGGYAGDECRRWGVKNLGLCLLIAWTNEIIQIGDGLEF